MSNKQYDTYVNTSDESDWAEWQKCLFTVPADDGILQIINAQGMVVAVYASGGWKSAHIKAAR